MRTVYLLIFSLVCLLASIVSASAGVTMFDHVVAVKKTIRLTALTKGRFFPEGGKLVTFYVDEKKIGTTLSGGDGFAFLKYQGNSSGVLKLRVVTGDESDEGALLVTGKKDKVLIAGMDNTLYDNMLAMKPMTDSKKVLEQLSIKYRIIYLSSFVGTGPSKKWLRDNMFPLLPVLKWEGTDMIDEMRERGIHVHAIIASPEILAEATGVERRFSFGDTEEGRRITDWNDLLQQLQSGGQE